MRKYMVIIFCLILSMLSAGCSDAEKKKENEGTENGKMFVMCIQLESKTTGNS